MICSTIRRTLSILTACSLLAAPAVLFTGCGSNSDSAAPQQTTASNAQSREAALSPYLEATNDYNHNIVTFNFAIAPSLDSLRKGEHKEHISLPNFENLKTALEKARSDPKAAGVYPDIDAAADDLLAVLKDLEPLATKLESYYSAKTYMTDNYAQSDEMVAQFFPLYDKFDAAYDKFDAIVTDRYKELRLAQIDALRSEGKENAASFLELNGKTRELVEMLDGEQVNKNAAEAKIGEISALLEKLPSGTGFLSSYKSKVNSFIGQVREYTSGSPDPKKFNNVIEEFNSLSSTSSNVDINELDGKKK